MRKNNLSFKKIMCGRSSPWFQPTERRWPSTTPSVLTHCCALRETATNRVRQKGFLIFTGGRRNEYCIQDMNLNCNFVISWLKWLMYEKCGKKNAACNKHLSRRKSYPWRSSGMNNDSLPSAGVLGARNTAPTHFLIIIYHSSTIYRNYVNIY